MPSLIRRRHRGRYAADPQLSARMGLVVFLLGAVYLVAMAALIAAGVNAVAVIVVAVGFGAVQYFASDAATLYGMNARIVTPAEAPELHGLVDRICALADLPKPRVAVADTDSPNAFAVGRSPSRATICATTGIMRRLSPEELEGVLAHELAHVAHRDVAVMTIAGFLGVVAGLVTRIMFWTGMMGGFGGGGDSNDNQGGDNAALVELAVLAVSIVVYAISFLLTRALSRYRELAADRAGALLTGQPSVLASALVKVTGEMSRIPTRDLRAAESFNAFYFTPAIASKGVSLSTLFSTHPSLETRLAQLATIEAELGRPS
jgi:heat shock protein HtpX